jgi:hypothetical protein
MRLVLRLTTLPPSCAVVKKSGNLKLLENSGPPQACKGTALPFTRYGHVKRMPEERIPKLIMEWIPWERRKRGHPRKHGWKEYKQP